MEAQHLHRGRLIDHVQLVVQDLARSRQFYEAVFAALGVPLSGASDPTSGSMNSSSQPLTAPKPKAG